MGDVAECVLTLEGQSYQGKAYLESEWLDFSGDLRLRVPLSSVTSATMESNALKLTFEGRVALFSLGEQGQKWLHKILHPKGLLDKLGVKPHQKVSVLNLGDEGFLTQLRARARLVQQELTLGSDMVFLGATTESELGALPQIRAAIQKNGSIWVVIPKGSKAFSFDHVYARARQAGLVDIKVVKFSETHSAYQLVVPKADR